MAVSLQNELGTVERDRAAKALEKLKNIMIDFLKYVISLLKLCLNINIQRNLLV